MAKRVALYLRVSTTGQTVENQRRELQAAAEARGWTVVAEYCDAGISGAKGRQDRPQLDAILKAAVGRRFDVLMAWSVDRLGRSLADLIASMAELQGARVDLFLLQQGLDTTTPSGRAMFQMLGVFSEFERAMIAERVKAGMARAKESPRKGAKAIGRPATAPAVEKAVRTHLAAGTGMLKTAALVGVGSGTVQRIAKAMRAG